MLPFIISTQFYCIDLFSVSQKVYGHLFRLGADPRLLDRD